MTAKPSYEELEKRIKELETADNVRNKIEKELQKSEARHSKMVANIGDVIVIIDQEGINKYKSPNIEKLFGWKPEEVVGKSTWDNVHPDDIESTQTFFEKIMHTPDAIGTMECRYLCKDGSYKWIEFSGSNLFHDPDIQGLLGNYQDITGRKRAEEALKASETAIRNKLKAIVEPERDLGELELTDIIDVPAVQSLMENFHRITGMLSAIVDSSGKVLVDVGWQDICTKFHRCHPETQKNCVESDTALTRTTEPGRVKSFRCKNGLWDMSSPIVVSGRHMGNIYFGQFIYSDEQLDVERFCNQARQYGFDEAEYLAALNRVPRYDRKTVEEVMAFYSKLGVMISALSFSNIRLSKTLTEQKRTEEALIRQQRSIKLSSRIANVFLTSSRDEVFADVLDVLLKTLDSRFGYFGYINEAGDLVCPSLTRDVWDQCQVAEKSIVFPRAVWGGLWGRSLMEKQTLVSNENLRIPEGHVALENALATPIVHHDNLIGQFVLANKAGGYDKDDLELLESAAVQTAPILFDIQEDVRQKTAREKLEEQLRQAQKMESIGTLAGGIAHDFNNILFPIVGYTEMLLEDVPDDSPYRGSINEIYTGSLRARDLVHQILAFARQETSELKMMKMQPIIKEALKLIRSTIPTSISINQNLQSDCSAVKADPTQIHQIVMNLATNAYHAMEENGGELKVSLKEIKLGEHGLILPDMTSGSYACLTISDTGTGMDTKIIDKIFEPFFTTKENGKGTGMGLSVVHGIVKSMNGEIKVYSEPAKGTEFHIYLPIVKSAFETQESQTKERIQGGTERILLVDDEEAIVTMEKLAMERLGYHVTSRTSSVEALEAFKANPDKYDLVISDMAMPNMSGDRLASELIKIRPGIPILLCTGFSDRMTDAKIKSLGIRGVLFKPLVIKDFAEKIREILDDSRS